MKFTHRSAHRKRSCVPGVTARLRMRPRAPRLTAPESTGRWRERPAGIHLRPVPATTRSPAAPGACRPRAGRSAIEVQRRRLWRLGTQPWIGGLPGHRPELAQQTVEGGYLRRSRAATCGGRASGAANAPAVNKARLGGLWLHDLRHKAAPLAVAAGALVRELMEQGGQGLHEETMKEGLLEDAAG